VAKRTRNARRPARATRLDAPTRRKVGSNAESAGISNRPLGEERERQARLPVRGTKQGGARPRGGTTSGTRKKRGRAVT
jgi:hypothetical protein